MGCKLLQGLCTLFSEQNPYIQTKKQPFLDALAPIKDILEQTTDPQWNALAKRLETAPSNTSGAIKHFIYPIPDSKEIYLRREILEDLQRVCKELHPIYVDLLQDHSSYDKWNKTLDTVLNLSEIIKTGKQADHQPKLKQSPRYPTQSLIYEPL